jgi:xylan 1,4-beta-xylosidase
LVYQWVRHSVERYGADTVASWYWEVWNEPNIGYWQGTPAEYQKLYDFTSDAVKRAFPRARIGGPHSTGPADEHAAAFLTAFLEHCAHGTNYATGRKGARLDYIGFHAKGVVRLVDGHVQMGIRQHLANIERGFEIVASFPEFRHLPVIIGESDPEGCAACSAHIYPQNAYRHTALYASYTAAVLSRTLELAKRHGTHLAGVVTWAFEFEDQPYFEGLRSLATNGVDKPVLNVFRMLGRMPALRVQATSTGAASLDSILREGIRGAPDLAAMAARDGRKLSALIWNYQDDDVPLAATPVEVVFEHLPAEARRALLRHYRIDQQHSNSYTLWKELGEPQHPSPAQYALLQKAGQLAFLQAPERLAIGNHTARVRFLLPREAVSLLEISW